MSVFNKMTKHALAVLVIASVAGCQKMEQPATSDYPVDTNPPGGPLKFYAAFDERSVDSIRAVFGVDKNVSFVDGVSGKAVSADATGYVTFPSTNDFNAASSFTVAFWLKKTRPERRWYRNGLCLWTGYTNRHLDAAGYVPSV